MTFTNTHCVSSSHSSAFLLHHPSSWPSFQIHGGSSNIAATFVICIRIPHFFSFLLSIGFSIGCGFLLGRGAPQQHRTRSQTVLSHLPVGIKVSRFLETPICKYPEFIHICEATKILSMVQHLHLGQTKIATNIAWFNRKCIWTFMLDLPGPQLCHQKNDEDPCNHCRFVRGTRPMKK